MQDYIYSIKSNPIPFPLANFGMELNNNSDSNLHIGAEHPTLYTELGISMGFKILLLFWTKTFYNLVCTVFFSTSFSFFEWQRDSKFPLKFNWILTPKPTSGLALRHSFNQLQIMEIGMGNCELTPIILPTLVASVLFMQKSVEHSFHQITWCMPNMSIFRCRPDTPSRLMLNHKLKTIWLFCGAIFFRVIHS